VTQAFAGRTEAEIIALAAAGDERALGAIFSEYSELLRSRANLYFIVGADRDDVIQEGMIGLFVAIRSFDPGAGASFRTYAELCIKRQILNAVKMAGRKKHIPLNEAVSFDSLPQGGEQGAGLDLLSGPRETDPESIVLYADLLRYVDSNAPKVFSKCEREVWTAFIAGREPARIAAELGMTPKAVTNAIQRIKQKVEKLIALY